MTTFANSNLPQTGSNVIVTTEQLAVYVCCVMADIHGQNRYRERPNSSVDNGMEPIAVASLIPTPDGWRFVGRVSVPMSQNWMSGDTGLKLHKFATELVTGTFPTRFTS